MSKITDIFSSILKLDPDTDYEFTVTETKPPVPPAPETKPPAEQPPAPSAPPTTPPPATDTAELTALKKEIETLKAANLALLNKVPVNKPEKSLEEMLYNFCVKKEDKEHD